MATFYLDFEAGDDVNDGTSFANRWKTINNGATAARIAPGDTIRVMKSLDPTLFDTAAVWTANSKTVTLASALTANIDLCESAWTASANVTATAAATGKQGTNYCSLAIASGFTTGLIAYKATGTLDLSGYQKVSFWIQNSASIASSTLSLRLCSDTAGVTTVDNVAIPAISGTGLWVALTLNTGGALGSSIKSVALYADLDPGTVTILLDNILACKATSSADSITLSSLIGKVHNLYWVAGTTYAQNDKRKPTPDNRNGFCYKVQNSGGGTAHASVEPTWPKEIGATVVDNTITWVCEELEDTWYAIQSINGTTILLDDSAGSTSATGRGYPGATETVASYKFQPIPFTTITSSATTALAGSVTDSGTDGSPITFSGGWDRTDMSTRTGETWISGRNSGGVLFDLTSPRNFITIDGFGASRSNRGLYMASSNGIVVRNFHSNNGIYGMYVLNASSYFTADGCHFSSNNSNAAGLDGALHGVISRTSFNSTRGGSAILVGTVTSHNFEMNNVTAKNNSTYAFSMTNTGSGVFRGRNIITANNGTASFNFPDTDIFLYNSSIGDTIEFTTPTAKLDRYVYSQDHDQSPNNHYILTDGGNIISATDQRNTASGVSWKFSPTTTVRSASYPLRLSVAKIACKANTAVTIKIYTRRSSTNIAGQLRVRGGQIPGVGADVIVSCAPSINTWTQSSALTFTPTAAGVVEVLFEVWDGVGTTNTFWIDDLSVV